MSVRNQFLVGLCTFIIWVTTGQAYGDQRDTRLAPLFEKLRSTPDPTTAQIVEQQIWAIWLEIDDPQIRELLEQGMGAMARQDLLLAFQHFDQIVNDAPSFAEGWNKRATVHYVMGNFEAAVQDLQRSLFLEPRHFGALSGLGLIYDRLDNPAAALRSYEAALTIHPHLSHVKKRIDMLRDQLAGNSAQPINSGKSWH